MRRIWTAYLSLCVLPLVACGSSTSTNDSANASTSPAATTTTTTQAAATSLVATSPAAKMARQTHDDTQQQADLSETATSGNSDGGGTKPFAAQAEAGFTMQAAPGVDFANINGDFRGTMAFRGAREGGMQLDGNATADVRHAGNANLALVLTLDMNRTLDNGDVVEVVTEPNVVITKVGSRQAGTVTRTIAGTVHRALTSAQDANRDFDLTITHNGTVVVDTYASGSFELQSRLTNGTASVVDHLNNLTSTVVHTNVKRGSPQACLCPTGGQIEQTITQNGTTESHTYVFSGDCGASTVSVDGGAAVAAAASASAKVAVRGKDATAASTVHGDASFHAKGSLSWEQCVPSN